MCVCVCVCMCVCVCVCVLSSSVHVPTLCRESTLVLTCLGDVNVSN